MPGLHPDGSTKGPSLWVGGTIVAIAILLSVISVVGINDRISDFREVRSFSVPATRTVHLGEGEWRLMSLDAGAIVDAAAITISGPSPVRPRIVDSTDQFVETRTVDSDLFREIVAFDIDEAGDYTFDVSEVASDGTSVIIARATTSLISSAVYIGAWALLGLFGGVLFLVGLIPLIMSLVNRSRARRSRAMLGGYGSTGIGPIQ